VKNNLRKAIQLYQQAVDLGSSVSILNLGLYYENRSRVPQNQAKAI
jgi:TPR repeat protein